MAGRKPHIFIFTGLLAAFLVHAAFVFVPLSLRAQVIGFSGDLRAGEFIVSGVERGSPAENAGIAAGDRITRLAGRGVGDWHARYSTDLGDYLAERRALAASPMTVALQRDGMQTTREIRPRLLSGTELVTRSTVRVVLILLLAGLAVFIVYSGAHQPGAFVTSLSFCFTLFWLAANGPNSWLTFLGPLVPDSGGARFLVYELVHVLSLELVVCTLLHASLLFPERHTLLARHPHLPLVIYAVPLVLGLFLVAITDGSLLNRLGAVRWWRIPLNTIYLLLATFAMLHSYRNPKSPGQRERARWVVLAFLAVVITQIGLWNLPSLLLGHPLVPSYDWLLVPIMLIPVSMTVAISNHRLFGIRGILRRRIELLDRQLDRERSAVLRRDRHLEDLAVEIRELKRELQQYAALERPSARGSVTRLEARYPELAAIRRERLLGASPRWETVFEDTVVAAQGTAPVLVVGESGTGKTDLAWAIFRLGQRPDRPYREISCAQFEHADPAFALGRLFGIGRGHGLANAPRDGQPGLLEESDGGTVFLDDVDRLPPNVQDLLLFPLEGKAFEPGVGSGPARSVDIKFIFATNGDPEALVRAGRFRGDVLARIMNRVHIPPLRERREDIPLLVEHFVALQAAELGHETPVVSPRAMQLLTRQDYRKGNARELQAEIHRAIGRVMLEDDHVLRAGYLSDTFRQVASDDPRADEAMNEAVPAPAGKPPAPSVAQHAGTDTRLLAVLRKHEFRIQPSETELGLSHKSRTLSNQFRGLCIKALQAENWDVGRAARFLAGIDDPQLCAK
ncbi:MAG: sigma 54-interacting transcriptional regulator, partial [Gammaproteobacteria bacterium]|nr:sigma 54-interacting transcriptional regulator [Gammaproteobacteria bacterium]